MNLIEAAKERANLPPIDISTQTGFHSFANNSEEFQGRRVQIQGTFEHEKEVLLGPRSSPPGLLGPAAQGMATNPQV